MIKEMEGYINRGSIEEELIDKINLKNLPSHIAVIMDGNGRWAKKRHLPRIEGHRAGRKSVREIIETCVRLGIDTLTLYAFSNENWKRPKLEVDTLWKLLEEYLKKDGRILIENKIKLGVIGQKSGLPQSVLYELERFESLTKEHKKMTLLLALNYGGRTEIIDAVKKIVKNPDINIENLDEELFSKNLYTEGIPDPDLLIRTSGELRISNFLLWQIAYSEIWITPVFWPDFRKKHLLESVVEYQQRERRFGDIHS